MRDIIALRRTGPQESRWLVAIGKLTCGLPSRLVLYSGAMLLLVARGAQSDQVFFGIVATPTAKFLMVNFQVRSTPAILACPTIAPQHL